MKKQILVFLTAMAFVHCINAQTMVGTWKTISIVTEDMDGSKKDLVEMELKQWACLANLHTIFEANGKQYMKSPPKCGPMDYSKLVSTWKMNGKTISITNTSIPTPLGNTSTYTVDFVVNKAILTHEYSAKEKAKLHSPKVKKIIITYQRV